MVQKVWKTNPRIYNLFLQHLGITIKGKLLAYDRKYREPKFDPVRQESISVFNGVLPVAWEPPAGLEPAELVQSIRFTTT
jgi:hypothetical protein